MVIKFFSYDFFYGQTVTQEPLGTILTLITSPGNNPEAEYVAAV
jgi:hypothetical protein